MKYLLFIFCFFALAAQAQVSGNDYFEEGSLSGKIYHSKLMNWTIEVPQTWDLVTVSNRMVGYPKTSNIKSKKAGPKKLIAFQKSAYNRISAIGEPFKEEYPGHYEIHSRDQNKLANDAYIKNGIKTDTVSGKEEISGKIFNTFHITLYDANGQVSMHHWLCRTWYNKTKLTVIINYDKEEFKSAMLQALHRSIFE